MIHRQPEYRWHAVAIALLLLLPAALFSQQYVLLGWNDLGMHCSNKNFSKVVVLPPYNNVTAQLILKQPGQPPRIVSSGYTIEYSIPNNTYSVGKTDFWTYAQQLFGLPSPLPPNIGLTGKGLTGTLDSAGPFYIAHGIPVTPYADSDLVHETPFQLIHIVAKSNADGSALTSTDVVIPVSNEVGCVQSGCHASETSILNSHESVTGFNRNGPVLCASCHSSNALGTTGTPEAGPFSLRMHEKHAQVAGPANSITTCYKCHPGPNTQCLRDIMGRNPTNPLVCQNCHGTMDTVAATIANGRKPWLQEPRCGNCHGANYSEEPGKLYRQSTGHGGLFCSACHGSPHAIQPTVQPNDNLQAIRLQGFAGTLRKCSVCHDTPPTGPGPHGIMDTTSGPTAPLAPLLNVPANHASGLAYSSLQLQWNSSANAVAYDIQVATDSLFLSLVVNDTGLTGLSQTLSLASGSTFFWRVRASNAVGLGGWSSVWSFSTAGAPQMPLMPVLAGPADGIVGVSTIPVVLWSPALYALRYHVQVGLDTGFTSIVAEDSMIAGVSKQFVLPTGVQTYYWHVRGINQYGSSTWSAVWSFTTAAGITLACTVDQAWNLVSLPLMTDHPDAGSVFPGAISACYAYQAGSGYSRMDTLAIGTGYWVKYASASIVGVTGPPVHVDTVSLTSGWNLIGTISDSVTTGSMATLPPGIISSGVYGYRRNYSLQTVMVPGRAYWVKSDVPGKLVLSAVAGMPAPKRADAAVAGDAMITFRDATGAMQTLYLSQSSAVRESPGRFEMPPIPPGNVFDIRFASNRFAEPVDPGISQRLAVQMSGVVYPLTVQWSVGQLPAQVALDCGGVPLPLSRGGTMELSEGTPVSAIVVGSGTSSPSSFVLEQNYPNPFNPSTMFRYSLPARAHVELTVYDLTGRVVGTVVRATQEAGLYQIEWTPALASGLYLYRLSAVGTEDPAAAFTQVRKLLLLK